MAAYCPRELTVLARTLQILRGSLDDVTRIKRAIAEGQRATGTVPSERELVAETGMTAEKLALLRGHMQANEPISLDKAIGDDGERTLHDVLPSSNGASDPEQGLDLDRWHAGLAELLAGLSSIEAATLRMRFGLDGGEELTLREIGDKYNLSRERMRQIQEEALSKLRLAAAQAAPPRRRISCGLARRSKRLIGRASVARAMLQARAWR